MRIETIRKLHVSISLEGNEHEVGELIADGRKIYFRYSSSFLEKQLHISPFKLRLSSEIYEGPAVPFDGLHGVFGDSLPDGWGRFLLDHTLHSKGILFEDIRPLQRLAFVGNTGMGALQYRPVLDDSVGEWKSIDLDVLETEAVRILHGSNSSDLLEELFHLGGSSGGMRPKILIKYNPKRDLIIHGRDLQQGAFEDWMIKFASPGDRVDSANIELAYYYMALAAGIEMSKCRLFKGKSGRSYFGTKRFDRTSAGKLHMHSAAGLMHDDFRVSALDYGHIMDCASRLEGAEGVRKVFRLAAFNVFVHNREDHSKNFSFLMGAKGNWVFAPAYDLTFSTSGHGHHSTRIAGEGQNPGTGNLMELAGIFRIKKPKSVVDEVKEAVSDWKKHAHRAGVTTVSKALIGKRLEELLKL
jgi:serine/threonine-protein kinase HipA